MPSAEVILYAGAKRLLDRNMFILPWFCAVFAKLISPRTVKCHVVWYIMSKKGVAYTERNCSESN